MIDRTGDDVAERYVAFLLLSLRLMRERGLDPFLMLHETNDADLAAEFARRAGGDLEVVDPPALEAKAILGASRVVLSSRYHALIGSLSQGVPTVGTSWSHKYDELFAEYGCPEMLVSPLADEATLRDRLARALEEPSREAMRATLRAAAAERSAEVEAMWDDLRAVLGGGRGVARRDGPTSLDRRRGARPDDPRGHGDPPIRTEDHGRGG